MNPSIPDVKNITQAMLNRLIKQRENRDGTGSHFSLGEAIVIIGATYIRSTGRHRSWKFLYYLKIGGQKLGGYDRRDSFVAWAVPKIKEVASPAPAQAGDNPALSVAPLGRGGASLSDTGAPGEDSKFAGERAEVCDSSNPLPSGSEAVLPTHIPTATTSPAEHIAGDRSSGSTASNGAVLLANQTAPEISLDVVVRCGSSERAGEAGKSAVPQKARPPLLSLESLAEFSDEGETGWNAERRNRIAEKMQRIAAGGYNSFDAMVQGVEEVLT
jgi:hypothetical protein